MAAPGRAESGLLCAVRARALAAGLTLALVCSVKGYPLRIVTSDAYAAEKTRTMRALGAEVEVLSSPEGVTPDLVPRMIARSREILAEAGGYATDQFRNEHMLGGYAGLADELLEQLDGRIGAFCAYVGTGGCFCGVGLRLRETLPDLVRVAIEPAESAVLSGGEPGTHRIEGGGAGFWPPLLRREDFDRVVAVSSEDAFAMARRAAREEGLWSGPSTGANLVVALDVARQLGEGERVVTVLADSGLKYLAGDLYG